MSSEARLSELLQRWQELKRQGQDVPAQELCADCPELIDELQRKIQQSERSQGQSATESNADRDDDDCQTGGESAAGGTVDEATYVEDIVLQTSHSLNSVGDDITAEVESFTENPSGRQRQASEPGSSGPAGDEAILCVSQYDQFHFHAKGGAGEVYVAKDKELHRPVALKFIQRHFEDDVEKQNQFQVEGQVAAQLEHPGVVPVYGIGRSSDGRPFHIMRFIRGDTLGDAINRFHQETDDEADTGERSVQFRKLIACFVSVCNTMAYAHNRGVLHRDIKPENIMLGKYGETLVVDWGLALPIARDERARASGEHTLMADSGDTAEGQGSRLAGTPAYMSPEQASGSGDLGPTSDIYGLGAVLYKMITSQTAVQGSQLVDTLQKVKSGDFPPPRELDESIPGALEAICLKAMARDPEGRYQTTLELAADLERWLADEPVPAYREPLNQRLGRWGRKHRRFTQSAAALLVASIFAATTWGTSTWVHRENLMSQRLEDLKAKADLEQTILLSDFERLQNDVQFLAARPQLQSRSPNNEMTDQARQSLTDTFHDFLLRRPSYMQARFLDRNGMEKIRVERSRPGSPLKVARQFQNKKGKAYFTETMSLSYGQVYLSKMELNQEFGKKQWDFPVVRAAVPVSNGDQNIGIVIINMHFNRMAELVQSSAEGLLIYLINDEGEFLLHPNPTIGFCFERRLEYPIGDMYPRLATFCRSSRDQETELALKNVMPVVSVLIETKGPAQDQSHRVNDVVTVLQEEIATQRPRFSENNDKAILTGLDQHQLQSILRRIEGDFGANFAAHELPTQYRESPQVVFARKIFFDNRKPDRFLGLVLVLPYR